MLIHFLFARREQYVNNSTLLIAAVVRDEVLQERFLGARRVRAHSCMHSFYFGGVVFYIGIYRRIASKAALGRNARAAKVFASE